VVELRWQRVHPDDATRVAQALEGLDARNALFEVEYRSRTPRGTLVECVCPNGHGAAVRALQ
jgi:hypothetical protein